MDNLHGLLKATERIDRDDRSVIENTATIILVSDDYDLGKCYKRVLQFIYTYTILWKNHIFHNQDVSV